MRREMNEEGYHKSHGGIAVAFVDEEGFCPFS